MSLSRRGLLITALAAPFAAHAKKPTPNAIDPIEAGLAKGRQLLIEQPLRQQERVRRQEQADQIQKSRMAKMEQLVNRDFIPGLERLRASMPHFKYAVVASDKIEIITNINPENADTVQRFIISIKGTESRIETIQVNIGRDFYDPRYKAFNSDALLLPHVPLVKGPVETLKFIASQAVLNEKYLSNDIPPPEETRRPPDYYGQSGQNRNWMQPYGELRCNPSTDGTVKCPATTVGFTPR